MKFPRLIFLSAAFACITTIGAIAADLPGSADNAITPQQAIGRQGQNVVVEGVADVTEADGLPGLYVHLSAPDSHVPFVGYISTNNEEHFPDPRGLNGKTIAISGVVETDGSIPMIRLTSPDQIKIIR